LEQPRKFAITQQSGENAQQNLDEISAHDPASTSVHRQTLITIRSTAYKLLYSNDTVDLFELPDTSTTAAAEYPEIANDNSHAREGVAR
jgi:hypothetical protein